MSLARHIESVYPLAIKNQTAVRDVRRLLVSDGRALCCKTYDFPDAEVDFIADCIAQLAESGYRYGPKIVTTGYGKLWTKRNDKPIMITNWINGRSPNFRKPSEWKLAVKSLARFHRNSLFPAHRNVPASRERYANLTGMIANYRDTLQQFPDLPLVDLVFLCDEAMRYLREPKSIAAVEQEANVRAWVHGDYNYPNLVLDQKGKLHLIDFENASLQARMTDLAHILYRNVAWNYDGVLRWIEHYDRYRPLSAEDRFLLHALLYVPYPLIRAIRASKNRDKLRSIVPTAANIHQYIKGISKII